MIELYTMAIPALTYRFPNTSQCSSQMKALEEPACPMAQPQRKVGLIQDGFEKAAGGLMALFRAPSALVSGAVVGGYQGLRSGNDVSYKTTPEAISKGLLITNVSFGLLRSGGLGYMVAGPMGAAVAFANESVTEAGDVFMFIKGGSANQLGRDVHAGLSKSVEPGSGAAKGALKGLVSGTVSATKSGTISGFYEGKGAIAGTVEALKEIPNEMKAAKKLPTGLLKKSAALVAGVVGAVLGAPPGLAQGLVMSTSSSNKPPSARKRKLIALGGTAALGAAIGFVAGPLGAALGAGAGALLSLLGPGSREDFNQGVSESVSRSKEDNEDLGHQVGNNMQRIVESIGVGGLAGMREGWDRGVALTGN